MVLEDGLEKDTIVKVQHHLKIHYNSHKEKWWWIILQYLQRRRKEKSEYDVNETESIDGAVD